jgi:hypothetical protein
MLGSCISAMYGVVAGASTKLGCVSSVTIASLRRGGFAGGPDLTCESTDGQARMLGQVSCQNEF